MNHLVKDTEPKPKPKVSIVMPVYNAERYLARSVQSALAQTLDAIELVCVNDCSTDASGQILQTFAQQDSRISIVEHRSNRGEGAARNTGIDNARGDFVFHLDADDALPENALALLYREAIAHESEMVKGGLATVREGGFMEPQVWSRPKNKTVNTNIYNSSFLERIPTSHCSYLYERSFLNKHNIRYRSDLVIGLDLIALTQALLCAKSVTLICDIVYYYHQTEDSAVRGALSVDVPLDAIRTQAIISGMLEDAGLQDASRRRLQRWAYDVNEYWLRMASSLGFADCSRVFTAFRQVVGKKVVPWSDNVAHHHRYVLALVMAEHDEEAVDFLKSENASVGFVSDEVLQECLEFVCEQFPQDKGSLLKLGLLAQQKGQYARALVFFQRVIDEHPGHIGAHIQASVALRGMDQAADGQKVLDSLVLYLAKVEGRKEIKQLVDETKALNRAKFKVLTNDIENLQSDLVLAKDKIAQLDQRLLDLTVSRSWRLTAPLRWLSAKIKTSKS